MEARELGVARMRAMPEISLLLHRLKLTSCVYTAATVVSSLCLLLPHSRPLPRCDALCPTLGIPRPSLLQTVGEEPWPGSGTHVRPQFARLPTSEGEGEHLAAEAWKCFSCCPGRPETSRRLCLIKVEKDAFLPARVCWGLPILHPPLQAQE